MQVSIKGIRARLYSTHSSVPRAITVHVQQDSRQPANSRFVLASHHLSNPQLQSHVHDIVLTVRYRGVVFNFLVFFKRHKFLPLNRSIQNLGGREVHGDVLLVACGIRVSVRNLRSGLEDRAADRAIRLLTEALDPMGTRHSFPETISFV
ncbi:hypothetical protein GGU11DRAFT_683979 [Lentinula aff. detonsa]|nr:hypothetical protein GGU11DRAFT_683979 [Lentinula aff. detonsa]